MGKKEKRAKKEKEKIDIQNNDLQQEKETILKKCKVETDVLNIQDILRHSSSSGKLGPILPSFSHAPCAVPLLAAADPQCSIEVQWKGDNPQPRSGHMIIVCELLPRVFGVLFHNKLNKEVIEIG